jgi:hypothetical protein
MLMLLSLLGAVIVSTFAVAMHRSDVQANTRALIDHTTRIERLEASQADIAVIRNDVKWIRQILEDKRPAR